MKIGQSNAFFLGPTSRAVLYGPDGKPLLLSELIPKNEQVNLRQAVAQVARETVTPSKVAIASGTLLALPAKLSADQASQYLVTQSVAPQHADGLAKSGLDFLGHPLVRSVLVFVAGTSVALIVVQKTTWPTPMKWLAALSFGAALLGLYRLAVYLHWLR